jgi:hypothetical protein
METQNKKPQPQTQTLARSALLLHEQLALKRLKELEQGNLAGTAPKRRHARIAQVILKAGEALWSALFRQPAITYHVAPGQPPVEWHGYEGARVLRAMHLR